MIRLLHGDARALLPTLASESVHACVTSPPYWNLRSYLAADHPNKAAEIGSERTPDEYIAALVEVFLEVRRILHPTGCVMLNLGDGYSSSSTYNAPRSMHTEAGWKQAGTSPNTHDKTLAPKQLMMMPARVAIALQADGWWLRSQMPWIKRSCMPESVTDRPTSAIEYVFMLTKSGTPTFWTHRDKPGSRTRPEPDYRWVRDGVETDQEPPEWRADKRWRRINLWDAHDYYWDAEAVKREGEGYGRREWTNGRKTWDTLGRQHSATTGTSKGSDPSSGRNFRNSDLFFDSLTPPHGLITDVDGEPLALDVNPAAYSGAHFATFPAKLIEPLIRASTSEKGCCPTCLAPWVRVVERSFVASSAGRTKISDADWKDGWEGVPRGRNDTTTTGWRATCSCPANEPRCSIRSVVQRQRPWSRIASAATPSRSTSARRMET